MRQLGLEHLVAALLHLAAHQAQQAGSAAAVPRLALLQLLAWAERLAETHELAGGSAALQLEPLKSAALLPVQVGGQGGHGRRGRGTTA